LLPGLIDTRTGIEPVGIATNGGSNATAPAVTLTGSVVSVRPASFVVRIAAEPALPMSMLALCTAAPPCGKMSVSEPPTAPTGTATAALFVVSVTVTGPEALLPAGMATVIGTSALPTTVSIRPGVMLRLASGV